MSIGEGLISGIASAIKHALLAIAGKAVARMFAYFGITFSVQKFIANPLVELIKASWGDVPGGLMEWMGALGIDKATSIMICALILSSSFGFLLSKKD